MKYLTLRKKHIALPLHILLTACTLYPNETQVQSPITKSVDQEFIQLGKAFKNEGNREKAISYFKKALEADPQSFDALFHIANILLEEDKTQEAIETYKKAITIKPQSASAHFNLGICYNKLNQGAVAQDHFKKAVEYNPAHSKASLQLAQLLLKQDKKGEAFEQYKRLLMLEPHNFDVIYKTASLYKDHDQFEKALELYKKALEINPKHIGAMLECANAYNMLDYDNEAIQIYKKILEISPNITEALYNIGFTLKKQGHFKEAMEVYKKLIELRPNYAHPRFSLSLAYLALGDFENGWREYEWRWAAYNEKPRQYKQPTWEGQDLHGKTIFLYAEQGLGDTFQFIRYAKVLKDRGARVIFDTQRPLKKLLSMCPYIDTVVTGNEPLPHFDYQIPLMSLPFVLKTREATIPQEIPYLYADPKLSQDWAEKLSADKNIKIGICWQGNANYSTPFLRKTVAAKSMHVSEFEPLGQIPGISLYSLQKVNGCDQLKSLSQNLQITVFDETFDDKNGRFMDSAAVVKNLDLVITIDTSISHFAAALGTPTWIMLPNPADWRWMLNRTDTPWYPNVRLFKQPKPGDWKSVILEIAKALVEFVQQKQQNSPQTTNVTISFNSFGELVDQLTMLLIKPLMNSRTIATKAQELEAQYEEYRKKLPELDLLKNQLLEINTQLHAFDLAIQKVPHSVFHPEYQELTRKTYHLYDLKRLLIDKINLLVPIQK